MASPMLSFKRKQHTMVVEVKRQGFVYGSLLRKRQHERMRLVGDFKPSLAMNIREERA